MNGRFIVEWGQAGWRLDQAVAVVSGCSRSQVKRLMEGGCLTVNGSGAKAHLKLAVGDEVVWQLEEELLADEPQAEVLPLEILFEDEALLVVNKQPGVVVHPGAGQGAGTLLNGLLGYDAVFREVERAGIVHRLDKDTSGVLVVAKSEAVREALQAQFKERTTGKQYRAVVRGCAPQETVVRTQLGRHPVHRKKQSVLETGGREAVSRVYCEEVFAEASLVRVAIETGRTHQIRVHMAHLGHPVLGDALYGGRKKVVEAVGVERQLLHAWRLELSHPVSGERFCFEAPMPGDMVDVIQQLRETI